MQRERTEAVSFNVFSKLENSRNEGVAMKFILQLSIFLITPYRPEKMLRMEKNNHKDCKKVCGSGFVLKMFCLFALFVGFFPYGKRTQQRPDCVALPPHIPDHHFM